jgi:hypothetical protein
MIGRNLLITHKKAHQDIAKVLMVSTKLPMVTLANILTIGIGGGGLVMLELLASTND